MLSHSMTTNTRSQAVTAGHCGMKDSAPCERSKYQRTAQLRPEDAGNFFIRKLAKIIFQRSIFPKPRSEKNLENPPMLVECWFPPAFVYSNPPLIVPFPIGKPARFGTKFYLPAILYGDLGEGANPWKKSRPEMMTPKPAFQIFKCLPSGKLT